LDFFPDDALDLVNSGRNSKLFLICFENFVAKPEFADDLDGPMRADARFGQARPTDVGA
jgi:hypothetical protein